MVPHDEAAARRRALGQNLQDLDVFRADLARDVAAALIELRDRRRLLAAVERDLGDARRELAALEGRAA